ncbi:MAG: hypothetical protein ACXWQZ_14050 [Ktedonobacterales bacterium]
MDRRNATATGKGKPWQRVEIYGEPIYCIVEQCLRLATVLFRCHTRVEQGWEYRELPLCTQHHQVYRVQMRKREPIAPPTHGEVRR